MGTREAKKERIKVQTKENISKLKTHDMVLHDGEP
jgi:hypothetical protein